MRDILRSAPNASSKTFVDEFMEECRETSQSLQRSTDVLLQFQGSSDEQQASEALFTRLMEALEDFQGVSAEYQTWVDTLGEGPLQAEARPEEGIGTL